MSYRKHLNGYPDKCPEENCPPIRVIFLGQGQGQFQGQEQIFSGQLSQNHLNDNFHNNKLEASKSRLFFISIERVNIIVNSWVFFLIKELFQTKNFQTNEAFKTQSNIYDGVFCKNKYYRKNFMFDWVLNTPLQCIFFQSTSG